MSSHNNFPNADKIRLLWTIVRGVSQADGAAFGMKPEEVEAVSSLAVDTLFQAIKTPADLAFFLAHQAVKEGCFKQEAASPSRKRDVQSAVATAALLGIEDEPSPELLGLLEVLATSTPTSPGSSRLMSAIAARYIREGREMPLILRKHATSVLEGAGPTRSRGQPPKPREDDAIFRMVEAVYAAFGSRAIMRGDHQRERIDEQPRSVCDIVALALRDNGVPIKTPDAIYQAYRRGKKAAGTVAGTGIDLEADRRGSSVH